MKTSSTFIAAMVAAGVVSMSSCSTMKSAREFVTDSAKSVKNVFVPSSADSVRIDNDVREKFGRDSVAADDVPSGAIVTEINDKALNKGGVDSDAGNRSSDGVSAAAVTLAGEWVIMSVYDQPVEGDVRPYITIDPANGRFYGSNGCNTINGSVGGDAPGKVSFDDVLSTMRACADAPYEYTINMALSQVCTYVTAMKGQESYLTLGNDKQQPVMVLRKNNMDYINGAWTVTSMGDKPVEQGKITLTIDLPEMHVHGNAGCNIINGELYIDPDKPNSLQFGRMATTRMTCPDINLEMEFLLTLESVESCRAAGGESIVLSNASGQAVMTLSRINLTKE